MSIQAVFLMLIFVSVVGVLILRALFADKRRDADVKALTERVAPKYVNPDKSLSRQSMSASLSLVTLPPVGGTLSATEGMSRSPRLGALCKTDEDFSELAFLEFAVALYQWAHEARGRHDRHALSTFFSAAALETFMAGSAELKSVSDVRVGQVRTLSVYADERWASVELELRGVQTEQLGETTLEVFRTESWRFRRRAEVRSPDPDRLISLGCPHCGSTAIIGPNQLCTECGKVRSGPDVAWEIAGIASERNPQAPRVHALPLSPTGHPRPLAPNLKDQMEAFEKRFRNFSWDALYSFVTEEVISTLTNDPAELEGPMGRRLRYERLLTQRRRADRRLVLGEPKVETVLALSEDAGHIFVDLRLALTVQAFFVSSSTQPPEAIPRQCEVTLARSKRERKGGWLIMDIRWVESPDDES
jgi:predicted lipid-binding transport protein (Tim44 family)